MSAKALILVLLGSSLTLASPTGSASTYDDAVKELRSIRESIPNLVSFYERNAKSKLARAAEVGKDAADYFAVKSNEAVATMKAELEAALDEASGKIEKLKNTTPKTSDIRGIMDKAKRMTTLAAVRAQGKLNEELKNAEQRENEVAR